MHRRTYLGALASGVGLTAGCSSNEGGGGTPTPESTATETPTPTPEPTPEPTETPTPAPSGPRIEESAMVWGTGGDDWLSEKAIESASVGSDVSFGFDYVFPAEREEPEGRAEARITDENGSTATSQGFDFELDAADRDVVDQVGYITVPMDRLSAGSYTAELTVKNKFTDETSDGSRVNFELIEPLGERDVRLLGVEPKTAPVGTDFTWTLRLANRSDRSNSIVGSLTYSPARENWSANLREVSLTLPANDTVGKTLPMFAVDNPITYEWEIPSVDISWETEFVESTTPEG